MDTWLAAAPGKKWNFNQALDATKRTVYLPATVCVSKVHNNMEGEMEGRGWRYDHERGRVVVEREEGTGERGP